MELEIKCPECGKQSRTAWDRVPSGKVKTTCHGCQHQFNLNKESSINCKVLAVQEGPEYGDSGWKVEHPLCQGMEYDTEGMNGLIRSGMVGKDTRVLPPGERGFRAAGEIPQFRKGLEQWEAKNARANR